MDYFTLFNVPKNFKINKKLLSKRFYQLQLQFHPDLFINDSTSKKKIILEKSMKINKGYKILNNFLSRAIYLLSLHGFKIKKETILLKNNNFLIKYFSLYEELDYLKKENFNEIQLNCFLQKIEIKINKYKEDIDIEFKKNNYKKIIKIIEKFLFFEKLKINLKKEHSIFLKQI